MVTLPLINNDRLRGYLESLKCVDNPFPQLPERVLDAPGLINDHYLNHLDWSIKDILAIALGSTCYLWNNDRGIIHEIESEQPICTLGWIHDGSALSFVDDQGIVQIFDINRGKVQRRMAANDSGVRTLSMSWNKQLLTCGSQDSLIRTFDIRVKRPIQNLANPSKSEVSSLKWSIDGSMFATGSIDGHIGIISKEGQIMNTVSKAHNSEIKAMSWCPWQTGLLATGGGSNDHHLKLWHCSPSGNDNKTAVDNDTDNIFSSSHIYQVWNQDLGSPITNLLWSKPVSSSSTISRHSNNNNAFYPSQSVKTNINANSSNSNANSSSSQCHRDLIVSHNDKISFWSLDNWSKLSQRGMIKEAHLTASTTITATDHNNNEEEQGKRGKILSMVLNPNGTTLCSIGSDENIKLWKCYKNNSEYKGPLLSELVPTRAHNVSLHSPSSFISGVNDANDMQTFFK